MDSIKLESVIRPSQGVHLVIDKSFLKGSFGILVPKTSDGRVLFAVPWLDHVIIGTTDSIVDKPSFNPLATQNEINFILENIKNITLVATIIGLITLLGAAVGLMNIMLVSVTERTREIGARLAIGAREADILTQFLIEAITLSLVGGLFGILLGVLGNQIIYRLTDFYIPTALYSILIGFGFSALVGIAFGYFPARKAAKLNPIDALRYE